MVRVAVARRDRPPWWPLFIAAERAIGSRLEEATQSEEFARTVTRLAAVQEAVRAAYYRATADQLHRANLPAWSDIRRLNAQLAQLERKVADLADRLDRQGRATAKPRSSRRRPPVSGR